MSEHYKIHLYGFLKIQKCPPHLSLCIELAYSGSLCQKVADWDQQSDLSLSRLPFPTVALQSSKRKLLSIASSWVFSWYSRWEVWLGPSPNSQKSTDFPRHFLLRSQVLFVSMIAKQSIDSNVIFLTLRTSAWVLSVDSTELQAFWILFFNFFITLIF